MKVEASKNRGVLTYIEPLDEASLFRVLDKSLAVKNWEGEVGVVLDSQVNRKYL